MLEHSKSLDMNDFLYNVSMYMINLYHLQPCTSLAAAPLTAIPSLFNIGEFGDFVLNSQSMYKDCLPTPTDPSN
jgi:hypothetical protein